MLVITKRIGKALDEAALKDPPQPYVVACQEGSGPYGCSSWRLFDDAPCRFISVHAESDEDGSMEGQLWEEGTIIANWLRDVFSPMGLAGTVCVELGAGTGIVGIVAGILGASVLITDLEDAVATIGYNVGPLLPRVEL